MSSWKFFFTVKDIDDYSIDDTNSYIEKAPSDFTINTDGSVYVKLSISDTDLSIKQYKYDLQVVLPTSPESIYTLAKSRFNVIDDVTKRDV